MAVAEAPVSESVELLAPSVVGVLQPTDLFKPNGLDTILAKIREQATALTPDISTEKGRKAIASMARKVASSKVFLDDLGKNLVADKKAEIAAVDAERKRMRDELDQLRDETRAPLTEFEEREKSRIEGHESALREIEQMGGHCAPASVEQLQQTVLAIEAYSSRDWQEFAARHAVASETALSRLRGEIERQQKAEAERAELERLRKAEAERQQGEREQRIREEAAAKAKAEADAAAQREREAMERKAREEKEALERAKREADERARQSEIAAEQAKRDAEQAVERERQRAADEAARIAAEEAKREADKKHREKIHSAASGGIVSAAGISESHAAAIVLAISRGEIQNVRITY
jgi:hypothetical protein